MIRSIAPVKQEQVMDSRPSLSQMKFLINGKLYPYSEVARRMRKAKQPGIFWSDKSHKPLTQPSHVQIVSSPVSEGDQSGLIPFVGHITDDLDESLPKRRSSSPEIYARWAEIMDCSIRDCFLDLVSSEENATILPTLSYPEEHLVPAKFFFNIMKYFRGAHDNGHFVRNEVGELVSHVSAKSVTNVNNFYKCCITAFDLLERGYPAQGFALLSNALSLLDELLEERDLKLIDTICDVSVLLLAKGWDQLYDILNARICGMIEIRALSKNEELQPWAQMFACLRKLSPTQALECMRRGWHCGYNALEDIHPGHAWEGLNMSCSSDYPLRMGEHLAPLHQDIMSAWFSVADPAALSSMRQQFACGNVLYYQKDYREALGTMQSIISRCVTAREQGDQTWVALEIEAFEVSARCSYAISIRHPYDPDISAAVDLLGTAIARSESVWGVKSATTIALQHTLWLWLLNHGRHSEAESLRNTIDAVLIKPEPEVSDFQLG